MIIISNEIDLHLYYKFNFWIQVKVVVPVNLSITLKTRRCLFYLIDKVVKKKIKNLWRTSTTYRRPAGDVDRKNFEQVHRRNKPVRVEEMGFQEWGQIRRMTLNPNGQTTAFVRLYNGCYAISSCKYPHQVSIPSEYYTKHNLGQTLPPTRTTHSPNLNCF